MSEEARRLADRQLRIDADALAAVAPIDRPKPVGFAELSAFPCRFWFVVIIWLAFGTCNYGVILWAPIMLPLIVRISPSQAAGMFVTVSLTGFVSKRRAGAITGIGMCVTLTAVAFSGRRMLGAAPLTSCCSPPPCSMMAMR